MNRNTSDVPSRPGPATNVHRLRRRTGAAAAATDREYPDSDEERDEAVALAERVGDRQAAEQLGISVNMVRHFRVKQARDLASAMRELVQAGVPLEEVLGEAPDWRTVRLHTADKLAQAAGVVRERAVAAALDGNDRLLRSAAIAIDVFLRSAQAILASEPQRSVYDQSPADAAQWVVDLKEELRQRVAAKVQAEAEAVGLDTPEDAS